MVKTTILSVAVLLSTTAAAAPPAGNSNQRPNLEVSLTPPAGVAVYATGGYNVRVRNIGNKPAAGVQLVIELPRTATSPSVYVMGNLGAFSTSCTRSNTTLTCSLGSIAKNGSSSVFFDIALPYSTAPLVFTAAATTTSNPGDNTPANNSLTYTASPLTVSMTVNSAVTAVNQHCTGQPSLSSFFECRLFPSSLSSHETIFNSDGSITFVGAPASFTGSWTYTPAQNRLQFQYFDGGSLVATFDGRGVNARCAEGRTTFTPDNGYISLYEVCF